MSGGMGVAWSGYERTVGVIFENIESPDRIDCADRKSAVNPMLVCSPNPRGCAIVWWGGGGGGGGVG